MLFVLFIFIGWKSSRRKQAPFPFSRDINPNVICAIADKLWKELVGGVKEPYQFTHLGIAFHGIEVVAAGQQHINGFFRASTPGQEKPKSLSRKRKRSISEAPLSKPKESSSAVECTGNMFSSNTGDANLGSWKCPKCGTEIMVDPNFDINDQLEQLTKLRMIHEDGHFAESLSASLNASSQLPSPSTSTIRSPLRPANKSHNPVKKKRRKQDDLLNFFERQ
jgi:DNA polymerase eta